MIFSACLCDEISFLFNITEVSLLIRLIRSRTRPFSSLPGNGDTSWISKTKSKMSDIDEPEGTYAIFFAEGEALAKQGQYTKAVDSYTKV